MDIREASEVSGKLGAVASALDDILPGLLETPVEFVLVLRGNAQQGVFVTAVSNSADSMKMMETMLAILKAKAEAVAEAEATGTAKH